MLESVGPRGWREGVRRVTSRGKREGRFACEREKGCKRKRKGVVRGMKGEGQGARQV